MREYNILPFLRPLAFTNECGYWIKHMYVGILSHDWFAVHNAVKKSRFLVNTVRKTVLRDLAGKLSIVCSLPFLNDLQVQVVLCGIS